MLRVRPFDRLAPHVQRQYLAVVQALASADRPMAASGLAAAALGSGYPGAPHVASWAIRSFFGETFEPERRACVRTTRLPGAAYAYQLTQRGLDKARQALLDCGQSAPRGGRAATNTGGSADMSPSSVCTARVYLVDGPTLRLTGEDAYETASLQASEGRAVTGTTVDGERVTIPIGRVQDVVGAAEPVALDPGIMNGRQIRLRPAAAYADGAVHVGPIAEIIRQYCSKEQVATHVVVLAEDMAEDLVMLYDLAVQQAVWRNPASSPRSLDLYEQAVRLLARAESEEVAFQTADGYDEDTINAVAQLDAGNVDAALNIAVDAARIESMLAARASGPTVEVKLGGLMTGWQGTIGGYSDPQDNADGCGRFEILLTHYNGERDHGAAPVVVKVEDIDRVLSWSVEDGFGADYSEVRVSRQNP